MSTRSHALVDADLCEIKCWFECMWICAHVGMKTFYEHAYTCVSVSKYVHADMFVNMCLSMREKREREKREREGETRARARERERRERGRAIERERERERERACVREREMEREIERDCVWTCIA